jgi:hypothetical protein
VSTAPDKLDVFVVSGSTLLTKRFSNGSWSSAWNNLGADATLGFAATTDAGDVVHLFAVSAEGVVQHLAWRPDLSTVPTWIAFDGARSDGGISAVTPRPGYVAVFVRSGGALRERWLLDGAWFPTAGWELITPGGSPCNHVCPCHDIQMDVTATSSGPERTDIVFMSESLYNLRWRISDGWRCEQLDVLISAPPVAAVRDVHRFDLFWLALDGDAMSKSWLGHDWSSEYLLGAAFTEIATASTGADSVFVFGRLQDRTIGFKEWTTENGWQPE